MARAASATARGIFSWGAPRRRGLWRLWPEEEKHLQLAEPHQDGGHPAGKVLLPIHQPPAAGEALHLSYVSFSDTNLLSVVWFGSRSRSCSETSWSLDLTGPFFQTTTADFPLFVPFFYLHCLSKIEFILLILLALLVPSLPTHTLTMLFIFKITVETVHVLDVG